MEETAQLATLSTADLRTWSLSERQGLQRMLPRNTIILTRHVLQPTA